MGSFEYHQTSFSYIDEETRDLLQEELLLGLPDTTEETAAR